jgi:hypothetical protein
LASLFFIFISFFLIFSSDMSSAPDFPYLLQCSRCHRHRDLRDFYPIYTDRLVRRCRECHVKAVRTSNHKRQGEDHSWTLLRNLRATIYHHNKTQSGAAASKSRITLEDIRAMVSHSVIESEKLSVMVTASPWPDVIEPHHLSLVPRKEAHQIRSRIKKQKLLKDYESIYEGPTKRQRTKLTI